MKTNFHHARTANEILKALERQLRLDQHRGKSDKARALGRNGVGLVTQPPVNARTVDVLWAPLATGSFAYWRWLKGTSTSLSKGPAAHPMFRRPRGIVGRREGGYAVPIEAGVGRHDEDGPARRHRSPTTARPCFASLPATERALSLGAEQAGRTLQGAAPDHGDRPTINADHPAFLECGDRP